MNRRSFLTAGTASMLLPAIPSPSRSSSADKLSPARAALPGGKPGRPRSGLLPAIPELNDLASDRLVHDYRDSFNPPTAQNE